MNKHPDNSWWQLYLPENMVTQTFNCQGKNIINIGKILPVCPICKEKTVWKPKMDGNFDVDFDLVYHCQNHYGNYFRILI